MCIYTGFMLLLLMHGLDSFLTPLIFASYQPTLNPFLFLRDLFGILILLGVAIAIYRRFILRVPRLYSNPMDKYAIAIVAVIVLSGFLLEGSKISSYSRYQDMVQEYTIQADEQESKALESFWIENFGVVSPRLRAPFEPATMELGREAHEMSCLECHSRPQWAFAGYSVAWVLKPVALTADRLYLSTLLWYLHFIFCLAGLAYLPFSKMFHIFATPLSLMANAVMDTQQSDPANLTTKRILELDACTHCGACSSVCAVAVVHNEIPNINILPSEKIASIRALAAQKKLQEQEIRTVQEGLYLCSNCYRCTEACPAGIDLQNLWFNVRETLLLRGYPEFLLLSPLSVYRGFRKESLTQDQYLQPLELVKRAVTLNGDLSGSLPLARGDNSGWVPGNGELQDRLKASLQANTFSHCFRCVTCSNACPVVRNYVRPNESLGLLPHQIMHAVGMRLWDLVFGSRMLWDCLGCYQCQDHCPQGVHVAEVLYELKSVAISMAQKRISL
ncbi:MAG: 4Fe-4S dicluster domain-containing protein [Deltaproteobacteria bacterium]|nr:4Fe-4S dicluster domain-containing protein [Deltaproteobacteria bacterium]